MRLAVTIALLATAMPGCSRTTAYFQPLRGNTRRAEADRCFRSCEAHYAGSALDRCLASCPDVQVLKDDICDASERPPLVNCLERRTVSLGKTAAAVTIGVVVVVVGYFVFLALAIGGTA